MALSTTRGAPPAQQAAPTTAEATSAEPTLHPETDPILLQRLYPNMTMDEARSAAMAAGRTVQQHGAVLQASQQMPIDITFEGNVSTGGVTVNR